MRQRAIITTSSLIRFAAWISLCVLGFSGCPRPGSNSGKRKDPHIVPNHGDYKEDKKFVSPPTLGFPIYACGTAITVSNYILGATIEVFIDGAPAPNPSFIAQANPSLGQTHDTGMSFTEGKVIYVTQTYKNATSAHSNSVTVTSHTADYPNGLPKPRLFKHPLYECGHAVLVEDVVPNSQVTIHTEDPDGAGGFKPEVDVGSFQASTSWGWNWTGVNPQFTLGARVTAMAKICTDQSPRSDPEITVTGPSPVPPGSTEKPVIDGQTLINIWGENGPPNDPPAHGAIVTLRDASATIRGQSAVPGGVPHTLGIGPPAVTSENFTVTQTLCTESKPGVPTTVEDCSALPAPIIKPPLPGDTKIVVTDQIPGAEILVFVNGQEIGHSSGSVINLSRALKDGETVIVVQRLGKCTGSFVYQIDVKCALGSAFGACSSDWPAFRQNGLRTARQVQASALGNPYAVKTLEVKASVTAPDGGVFVASPVIFEGRVFIGSNHGHLYAFDANFAEDAKPLWQYPPDGEPALDSAYAAGTACHNPSSEGIAASVAITESPERGTLVILAAPDRGRPDDPGGKFGSGLGSGRVFALNPATGALVWKTREEVARMSGTTGGSKSEFHEQIGYSSPLVLGNRIYVGVADHCDNPIQNGRVKAINVDTGAIDGGFNYQSTSDRGGGVWTYVSGGLANALVTTTGNVKNGTTSEPAVNNGLSMVRIDPATGTVNGKIQPVPYNKDSDPDWSAGATLMAASCGDIAASTMKDGFSYGGNLGAALTFRWQYPSVSYPFPNNDPLQHGDIRYHRAGAAWNDTYITMAGGQQILDQSDPVLTYQGYRRLHGINVCSGAVRWMAMLEAYTNPVSSQHDWALGPPTVTDGIIYVGTNRGFLLAIADPSMWPSQGAQCTLPTLETADCVAAGYQLVPNPTVLKSLDLGGEILRGEPALANGMVYVANCWPGPEGYCNANASGRLFRIEPEK